MEETHKESKFEALIRIFVMVAVSIFMIYNTWVSPEAWKFLITLIAFLMLYGSIHLYLEVRKTT